MKWSQMLLIVGMVILVAGAVLSVMKWQYSDYVLVAGALVIIFRGAIKSRERDDGK